MFSHTYIYLKYDVDVSLFYNTHNRKNSTQFNNSYMICTTDGVFFRILLLWYQLKVIAHCSAQLELSKDYSVYVLCGVVKGFSRGYLPHFPPTPSSRLLNVRTSFVVSHRGCGWFRFFCADISIVFRRNNVCSVCECLFTKLK